MRELRSETELKAIGDDGRLKQLLSDDGMTMGRCIGVRDNGASYADFSTRR